MTTQIISVVCLRDYVSRWLPTMYAWGLSTLAVVLLLGKFAIQYELASRSADSAFIRIAQQQATLSQQLFETAAALNCANDSEERLLLRKALWQTLSRWEESHRGLQYGDLSLNLTGNTSVEVSQRFVQLEPNFAGIQMAAHQLLFADESGDSIAICLGRIASHIEPFRGGMRGIILQFEADDRKHQKKWQRVDRTLSQCIAAILLLESAYLLLPVIRRLNVFAEALLANYRRSLATEADGAVAV